MSEQAVQIQRHDTVQVASTPMAEASATISLIERLALDPRVDVDKLERLMLMQERAVARSAKASYAAALAEMQPNLPTVEQNGRIIIREKNGDKIVQSTPYALWADINEAIKPALAAHGFALSFRNGTTPEGKITVTGVLSHRDGHSEETTIVLMHDSTGSKNNVQAIGSSISYGKRYTAGMLLNITSRAPGEADDDGKAAGASPTITDEQAQQINLLAAEVRANIDLFTKHFKIECIPDLPADKFDEAMRMLEAKRAKAVRQ